MSLVITIDTERWRAHQDEVRDAIGAAGAQVVPVAKGNGYGVGNVRLAGETARMGLPTVAVGTVHEAPAVLAAQPDLDVLVLEPITLRAEVSGDAWRALAAHPDAGRIIHTVASPEAALDVLTLATPETPRRVLLEGLTSMRRFGMTEDEIASAISSLAPALASGAIVLEGLALHLPIAMPEQPRVGSMAMLSSTENPPKPFVTGSARTHEVVAWGLLWPTLLARLAARPPVPTRDAPAAGAPVRDAHAGAPGRAEDAVAGAAAESGLVAAGTLWLSHLSDSEIADVHATVPDLTLRLRIGTRLWLGDRGALRARSTVLAVHATADAHTAGYHQRRAPRDGHVVVVSGGTSHGVALTAPRPASNVRQRAAAAGSGALEAAGRFRSPFHLPTGGHAWFLEPPHMHVSMLRIPRGTIPPPVGELIDCDVRFTTVLPDAVIG